jgi:hypothetical protein
MFDSNHVQNDFIYQTGGSICFSEYATTVSHLIISWSAQQAKIKIGHLFIQINILEPNDESFN